MKVDRGHERVVQPGLIAKFIERLGRVARVRPAHSRFGGRQRVQPRLELRARSGGVALRQGPAREQRVGVRLGAQGREPVLAAFLRRAPAPFGDVPLAAQDRGQEPFRVVEGAGVQGGDGLLPEGDQCAVVVARAVQRLAHDENLRRRGGEGVRQALDGHVVLAEDRSNPSAAPCVTPSLWPRAAISAVSGPVTPASAPAISPWSASPLRPTVTPEILTLPPA